MFHFMTRIATPHSHATLALLTDQFHIEQQTAEAVTGHWLYGN
jgi:hypothetical protein